MHVVKDRDTLVHDSLNTWQVHHRSDLLLSYSAQNVVPLLRVLSRSGEHLDVALEIHQGHKNHVRRSNRLLAGAMSQEFESTKPDTILSS